MDKIARLIVDRAQNLHQDLESLLDLDHWSPKEKKPLFEIQTDLSEILSLRFQIEKKEDLVITLFSRLSPFFDAGLLLYRKATSSKTETWVNGAAFYEGVYFQIPDEVINKNLVLPTLKKYELKKCAPYQILSPLGLTDLSDHSDSNAFVLKVHDDLTMVLMTKLPEPWLRLHVEKIYHSFIEANLLQNKK